MNGAFYHSHCFAHIINLAVQNGLNIPSVQHVTSLEEPVPFEMEKRIHEEEVTTGEAEPLFG